MYRLDVFYGDVADVVASVGGWLFDRVMAGWQVNLNIGVGDDVRPLQILGIHPHPLADEALALHRNAIAVAAHVLDHDDDVRKAVAEALCGGVDEVTVWGERSAAERRHKHRLRDAQYPLSVAARSFKAHALLAAGVSVDCVDQTEFLRTSSGQAIAQYTVSRRLSLGTREGTGLRMIRD